MERFKTLVIAAGLALAALVLSADFFLSAAAWAQDAAAPAVTGTPAVVVPYGDWLVQGLGYVREYAVAGFLALVAIVCRRLPSQISNLLLAFLTEQTIGRGVDWMFATMEGYARGRTMTLPQTNAAIASVEAYVIANAPTLACWLGDTLRPKIVARLSEQAILPADASESVLDAPLPLPKAAAA